MEKLKKERNKHAKLLPERQRCKYPDETMKHDMGSLTAQLWQISGHWLPHLAEQMALDMDKQQQLGQLAWIISQHRNWAIGRRVLMDILKSRSERLWNCSKCFQDRGLKFFYRNRDTLTLCVCPARPHLPKWNECTAIIWGGTMQHVNILATFMSGEFF